MIGKTHRTRGVLRNIAHCAILLALLPASGARAQSQACCYITSGTCFDDDIGVGSTCSSPRTGLGVGTTCEADCDCPSASGCTACMSKFGGNLGAFEFQLVGGAGVYNGTNTTFTYRVCQVGGHALSHFVIGMDDECCARIVSTSGGSSKDDCSVDPTTEMFGLKFETSAPPACSGSCGSSGHLYSVTLSGFVPTAGCIKFANKADGAEDTSTGCILGPRCEDPCEGVTCPGPMNSCDGGKACNPDTGLCENLPDAPAGTPCESDGDLCTLEECNGTGACVIDSTVTCPGPTNSCDGGQACNPSTGMCQNLPDAPAGTHCESDGNRCTIEECNGSGACVFESNVMCPGPTGVCDGGTQCNPMTGGCDALPDAALSTPCESDGNLCTNDHCDGNGNCVFLSHVTCPGPTNSCDGGQVCSNGTCVDAPDTPAGTSCDLDGDLCTVDRCNGMGACVQKSVTNCSHLDTPCSNAACNPGSGMCVVTHEPLSTSCEADGNLCTIDHCDGGGTCVTFDNVSCPGPTGPCDGGQHCDPMSGMCVSDPDPPLSTPCEADGDLCTIDHCDGSGSCVTFDHVTCSNPKGPCDAGKECNPSSGMCENLPDPPLSTPCERDGCLCTHDHCNGMGACVTFDTVMCAGSANPCDAGEQCDCATGQCVMLLDPPLSTPCEADGNFCTIDHCNGAGTCVTFDQVDCLAPTGPCDAGEFCDPSTGACEEHPDPPLSTSCEADGNLCTIDHCNGAGNCVTFDMVSCPGTSGPCDGGQHCEPATGACVDSPDPQLSTPCEADGDLCTDDHCDGMGACVFLSDQVCPGPTGPCDGGQHCEPATGMCVNNPDPQLSTPCEADGDLCTDDHCDGMGACVLLSVHLCPAPTGSCDGGQSCDPSTGLCVDNPDPQLSTPCESDGDLCTNDHCDGMGSCVFLSDVTCAGPMPPCEAGSVCNPSTGMCEAQPDAPLSTPCEADMSLCTNDHCDGKGTCTFLGNVSCPGALPPCEAGSVCNPATGACDPLMDAPLSTPCETDGNLCTRDHCNGSGLCVGFGTVSCPGPVPPCEAGAECNPATGKCQNLPDPSSATACNADDDECTQDHCDGSGSCVPGPDVCGACCDASAQVCTENVPQSACTCAACTWEQGETCAGVGCPGDTVIPTISEWGLAILALLLLIGGKLYFTRRDACSA